MSFSAMKYEPSVSEKESQVPVVGPMAGQRNEPSPAQSPAKAFLTFQSGPLEGKKVPLDKSTITIGRASDNDIVVDDPKVSRYHARFTLEGAKYIVEDSNSSNGTLLNGNKLAKNQLRNGDVVQVGGQTALFTHRNGPLVSLNEIRQ